VDRQNIACRGEFSFANLDIRNLNARIRHSSLASR
jgi:hypothetical protein